MTRWMLLSLLACTLTAASVADATPLQRADTHATATSRLDTILERLDAIEVRLRELKEMQRRSHDFWIDKNGVMRTASGHPIGFWGIDGPTPAAQRR